MVTATSKERNYVTEITDGEHVIYSDTIASDNGTGEYVNPADMVLASLAACLNITLRKRMRAEGLVWDSVTVHVDMNRKNPEDIKIYTKIIIEGDIPQEKKDELIANVLDCPICKVLRGNKTFLPLEME